MRHGTRDSRRHLYWQEQVGAGKASALSLRHSHSVALLTIRSSRSLARPLIPSATSRDRRHGFDESRPRDVTVKWISVKRSSWLALSRKTIISICLVG